MSFFKKHNQHESLFEIESKQLQQLELFFEKENKEIFQNLTDDQKALIINFIKVENTGKAISQWDDSVIGVYHKEKVYDGGIKTTVNNNHLTISSNNTEVVFEDYDYTDKYHIRFMGNASDRLYNIQKQIEQGKITVEKTVMEKAEKMFKDFTPEAMFKFCGVSKPFDSKGYPTVEAKQALSDINNYFFKDEPIEKTIEFIAIGKDNIYKTPEETKFAKLLSKTSGNDCDKNTYEEFEKVREQVIEMYKNGFDDEAENDIDDVDDVE